MANSIDAEILAARAAQAEACPPFDVTTLPTEEGRRKSNEAAVFFNDGTPEMASVEDRDIGSPGQGLRLRLYRPRQISGRGAILYIHGGGWYACNVDTHDRVMRCLAEEAGLVVAGIDFRLAPEHPFPAALEDCVAAWNYLTDEADTLSIDASRISVAGDSAGGNLALALSLWLRDNGRPVPAGAALLYACLAPNLETESSRLYGQGGYGLTADRMNWYWRNYLGPDADQPPALATPLYCDLRGLPPVFIGVAEADTIADESRMLYDRMRAAGLNVEMTLWRGAVHGFLQMTRQVALARRAVSETAARLASWSR